MKRILFYLALAVQNIRANLFHTFLSVLGIVIGVAALVAMLALIDGLENFAKAQIAETTSLQSIGIRSETRKTLGEISVPKDTYAILDYATYARMVYELPYVKRQLLQTRLNAEIQADWLKKPLGAVVVAVSGHFFPDSLHLAGKLEIKNERYGALINSLLAKQLAPDTTPDSLIGRRLRLKQFDIEIVGVYAEKDDGESVPSLMMPIALLPQTDLYRNPPTALIDATDVEKTKLLRDSVQHWLNRAYGSMSPDLVLMSYEGRLEQAEQVFLIFRVIMGLIIGISVVVGGVGIMNVLLISVTQRTTEIGLRKALGAKRSDIGWLFMMESIAISGFGSLLGLVFGLLIASGAAPLIRWWTKIPFDIGFSWGSFSVIAILALVLGIIFGSYPAMKAARLDPVEAMRRE